jgi:transcription-repair coupling factor
MCAGTETGRLESAGEILPGGKINQRL